MKLDSTAIDSFFKSMDLALPGLRKELSSIESDVYLLGAGVYELYASCGWCEELSRLTSDLDFSLESGKNDYLELSKNLEKLEYKKDIYHPYRYHSPSKLGRYAYVDLLTFTTDHTLEGKARSLEGAGEDFSFIGMAFAKISPLLLEKRIYAPNPLAFIFLKMVAYRENPDRRLKDFADIFEFVVGAIKKDKIFTDLRKIAEESPDQETVSNIKKMVNDIVEDSNPSWDYDQVVNQILLRPSLEVYSQEDFQTFFKIFLNEIFV